MFYRILGNNKHSLETKNNNGQVHTSGSAIRVQCHYRESCAELAKGNNLDTSFEDEVSNRGRGQRGQKRSVGRASMI
jgi:hypothetical protein